MPSLGEFIEDNGQEKLLRHWGQHAQVENNGQRVCHQKEDHEGTLLDLVEGLTYHSEILGFEPGVVNWMELELSPWEGGEYGGRRKWVNW